MKTSSVANALFSLFAIVALPAAAAPVAAEGYSTLTARNNIEVFVCTGTDFQGTCAVLFNPQLTCYNLAGQVFDHNTRSFGPEKGVFCRIFSDSNCGQSIDSTSYIFPGVKTFGSNNAHMGSFRCQNGPPPPR